MYFQSPLQISWDRWVDDHSGISHYVLEVFDLMYIDGQGLREHARLFLDEHITEVTCNCDLLYLNTVYAVVCHSFIQ